MSDDVVCFVFMKAHICLRLCVNCLVTLAMKKMMATLSVYLLMSTMFHMGYPTLVLLAPSTTSLLDTGKYLETSVWAGKSRTFYQEIVPAQVILQFKYIHTTLSCCLKY